MININIYFNVLLQNLLFFTVLFVIIIFVDNYSSLEYNHIDYMNKRTLEQGNNNELPITKRARTENWVNQEHNTRDIQYAEQKSIYNTIPELTNRLDSNNLTEIEKEVIIEKIVDQVLLYNDSLGDANELELYSLITDRNTFKVIQQKVLDRGIALTDGLFEDSSTDSGGSEGGKGGNNTNQSNSDPSNTNANNNTSNQNESNFDRVLTILLFLFCRFIEICQGVLELLLQ